MAFLTLVSQPKIPVKPSECELFHSDDRGALAKVGKKTYSLCPALSTAGLALVGITGGRAAVFLSFGSRAAGTLFDGGCVL